MIQKLYCVRILSASPFRYWLDFTQRMYDDSWYSFVPESHSKKEDVSSQVSKHRRNQSSVKQTNVSPFLSAIFGILLMCPRAIARFVIPESYSRKLLVQKIRPRRLWLREQSRTVISMKLQLVFSTRKPKPRNHGMCPIPLRRRWIVP